MADLLLLCINDAARRTYLADRLLADGSDIVAVTNPDDAARAFTRHAGRGDHHRRHG